MIRRLVAVLGVVGVVAAGCADDDPAEQASPAPTSPAPSPSPTDGEPSPSPSPTIPSPGPSASPSPSPDASASATPSPSNDDEPPFEANTEPDTGEASAGPTFVRNIDVAGHDGYDRVVFDIGGEGRAGWDVRYVDQAASQGSGQPVEVAGQAVLQVSLRNIGLPTEPGIGTREGPDRIRPEDTDSVREIVDDAIFEGQHVFFIGTDGRTPFRVFRVDDPQRVVVDVATHG